MRAKSLALCLSLLLATGVSAKQPGDQLTVVAPSSTELSYQRWSDRTADRLTNSIRRSADLYAGRDATGYARVEFRLDDQGRPQAIELAQPSSSRAIDRISMRAIKAMGKLTPLPQQVSPSSRFEAWVVVANDRWQKDDMLNELKAGHHARIMAQTKGERPVLIASR